MLSPLAELSLLLLFLYLLDCLHRVPPGGLVLERGATGRWRWSRNGFRLGRLGFFLRWSNPIPPLGPIFVCRPWPVLPTPSGWWPRPSAAAPRDDEEPAAIRSWEEVARLSHEEGGLRLDGSVTLQGTAGGRGQRLRTRLDELSKLDESARAAAIEDWISSAVDRDSIAERLSLFEETARSLRWMCNLMIAYLILVVVLLFFAPLYPSQILILFLVLIGLSSGTVWEFRSAHRRLYPDDRSERRRLCITLAFAPITASRSYQTLARRLFEDFEPLAVASVLLPTKDLENCARPLLAELSLTRPDLLRDDATSESADSPDWFRRREARALNALLKISGTSREEILRSPMQDSDGGRSYCAICGAHYRVLEGKCDDCGGVELVPLRPK